MKLLFLQLSLIQHHKLILLQSCQLGLERLILLAVLSLQPCDLAMLLLLKPRHLFDHLLNLPLSRQLLFVHLALEVKASDLRMSLLGALRLPQLMNLNLLLLQLNHELRRLFRLL